MPIGEKILIRDFNSDIGGGGTNTAVAFSRLGLKSGYLGVVGRDKNGDAVLDCLRNERVKFLGERKGVNDVSVVIDSIKNNRTVLTFKSVNNKLNSYPKFKTKWLYFSSMLGNSLKTQVRLAKEMISDGRVKLAINPRSYLIKRNLGSLKKLLKMSTILVLNREEARLLVKNGDLLTGLRELGPEIVCVTNQDKLIWCYDGTIRYNLQPHKIKIVERTGAGDAFASGLVAGIIKGLSVREGLVVGLKNSESVLRYFGAKNNLLRWKDVR